MTSSELPISLKTVTGPDLSDYVPALAALRTEVFREWPYLYDGDADYEERYLQTYVNSPGAVVVLALAEEEVVGAATGLPLVDETDEFTQPFLDHGYDPSAVFYCAESVLRRAYRGRGLGGRFFDERERHARTLGGFRYSCFCRVDRPRTIPIVRPTMYPWMGSGGGVVTPNIPSYRPTTDGGILAPLRAATNRWCSG